MREKKAKRRIMTIQIMVAVISEPWIWQFSRKRIMVRMPVLWAMTKVIVGQCSSVLLNWRPRCLPFSIVLFRFSWSCLGEMKTASQNWDGEVVVSGAETAGESVGRGCVYENLHHRLGPSDETVGNVCCHRSSWCCMINLFFPRDML